MKKLLLIGAMAASLSACKTTGSTSGLAFGVKSYGQGLYSVSQQSMFGGGDVIVLISRDDKSDYENMG